MRSELLDVVCVYANPVRWESRRKVHALFEEHMLDSGVRLTTVECAYGERPFELVEMSERHSRINRVQVRSSTLVWNKESLMNIGIQRLPHDWHYVCTADADIHFRNPRWAEHTVHALQTYQVVQPWADAYDLGPNGEHLSAYKSFCRLWYHGQPVSPHLRPGQKSDAFWKHDGGCYEYAHPGYCWAWKRRALDACGGLLEFCPLGEADNVMAKALVGMVDAAVPGWVGHEYRMHLRQWQARAMSYVHMRIGYVKGTIEHSWHGQKRNRRYIDRWDILKKHNFNPVTDLKRNVHGVVELTGNKPMMAHDIDVYFRQRFEDSNTMEWE